MPASAIAVEESSKEIEKEESSVIWKDNGGEIIPTKFMKFRPFPEEGEVVLNFTLLSEAGTFSVYFSTLGTLFEGPGLELAVEQFPCLGQIGDAFADGKVPNKDTFKDKDPQCL